MGNETMRVELTTSGGLTGLGVGSVKVDGSSATIDGRVTTQLTEAEEARLHRLPIVRASRPPAGSPDAVLYTLTIDGQRFSWSDVAAPAECRRWAEALLAIRERALDHPSSSM
jgi:hypothetical protein